MADNDILSRIKELMRHFNASSGQFADMINMDRSGFSIGVKAAAVMAQIALSAGKPSLNDAPNCLESQ